MSISKETVSNPKPNSNNISHDLNSMAQNQYNIYPRIDFRSVVINIS